MAPVGFELQIAYSVDEVGQAAWDRLAGGRPFAGYRWYRFGERAMAYARPVYAILGWRGEPVARATFWLTGREVLPVDSPAVRRALQAALRRWPLLICQAPLSSASTSGLILPEPPLRDAALRALVEVAGVLAREHRASFYMFPYQGEQARRYGWPPGCLWTKMLEPGTSLDITWSDYEGYLAHLNKKRRYNLRRTCRLAEQQGVQVRACAAVPNVDAALALHATVNRRHGSETEPWMRGALENAAMVDSAWLAAEVDGRLVGCELMLGDAGVWFVTGLGLDYSVPYAYFCLSCADIRCAIERGARLLRWGAGAYEVKERMGFRREDNNHVAFGGRGRALQRLGRWLAGLAVSQPDPRASPAAVEDA